MSSDLKIRAIVAVAVASLAIIIYIAIAFRKVPRPASSWRFGVCAVAALIHDLLFVIGVFAILGHFFGYEINSLFITALLTIMGFSVHDTIVVFDRIRENIIKNPQKSLADNAEISINQTIARSLNTSLTAILVLVSMLILGGSTIRPFTLMLAMGIGIGTYSSIFVASPILVTYYEYINRRSKRSK